MAGLGWQKLKTKTLFRRNHQNVTLTLSWNIIPNAGLLPSVFAHGFHSFKFPENYMPSPV